MTLTIVTDRDRLDQVRRRLAAESVSTIKRIQADVNAFAEGAAENILCEVADLQDRCVGKVERLGGTPAPKRSLKLQRLQQAARVNAVDHGRELSPAIQTVIGPWETDEHGVLGRKLWNVGDPPPP
jgi:hypothetical protein